MLLLFCITVNAKTALPISLKLKVAATEIKTATSMALYACAQSTRTIEETRSSYMAKKAKVAGLVKGDLTSAELLKFGIPEQSVINRLLQAENTQLAKMNALVSIGRRPSSLLKAAMVLKDAQPGLPKATYAENLSPLEQAQAAIKAAQAKLADQRSRKQQHSSALRAALEGALSALASIREGDGRRRLKGVTSVGRPRAAERTAPYCKRHCERH